MKELKIVWGRKATEQKHAMVGSGTSSVQDLVERAVRYMSSLQSPLYYDTPDGWFTKTTWNKWGEGVELTARVDFQGGYLFIMEIRERAIANLAPNVRVG